MAIRCNYPMNDLNRKIDRLYELAGLARMDGDKADEKRYLDEIKKLRGD